jgi:hypothetical protein
MGKGRSSFHAHSSIAGGMTPKTMSRSQLRTAMLSEAMNVTQVRATQTPITDQRHRGADMSKFFRVVSTGTAFVE